MHLAVAVGARGQHVVLDLQQPQLRDMAEELVCGAGYFYTIVYEVSVCLTCKWNVGDSYGPPSIGGYSRRCGQDQIEEGAGEEATAAWTGGSYRGSAGGVRVRALLWRAAFLVHSLFGIMQ
jgi:hypothetical protein